MKNVAVPDDIRNAGLKEDVDAQFFPDKQVEDLFPPLPGIRRILVRDEKDVYPVCCGEVLHFRYELVRVALPV